MVLKFPSFPFSLGLMVFPFGFSAEVFPKGHCETVGDQVGESEDEHNARLVGGARGFGVSRTEKPPWPCRVFSLALWGRI